MLICMHNWGSSLHLLPHRRSSVIAHQHLACRPPLPRPPPRRDRLGRANSQPKQVSAATAPHPPRLGLFSAAVLCRALVARMPALVELEARLLFDGDLRLRFRLPGRARAPVVRAARLLPFFKGAV